MELKANELRIGNVLNLFLGIDDNGANYRQIEISGIMVDLNDDFYYLDPIHNSWVFSTQNLAPIAIDGDWLLNMGFEHEYESKYTIRYSHSVRHEIGYDWDYKLGWRVRYFGSYIPITAVHQLQNLYFALIGEELQLKKTPQK